MQLRPLHHGWIPSMDIFSCISAAANCVKICYNIGKIVQSVRNVHKDVEEIHTEIDQLRQVLDIVKTTFSQPQLTSVAPESETGHRGTHWRSLKTALEDCQGTLRRLESLLQNVQIPEASVLSRPRTKLNLFLNSDGVAQLRQRIRSCRATVQMSLQAITLYSPKSLSSVDCESDLG
jgi:nicotinate-nucleotide pyrophosphorylase